MRTSPAPTTSTERERALARYNWLSTAEFGKAIGKSSSHVCRLIRKGKIKNVLDTSSGELPEYSIPPAELDRYVRENTINPAENDD